MMTDTLRLDSVRWAAWTANSDYDYGREVAQSNRTVLEQLGEVVQDWFDMVIGDTLDGISSEGWWVIALVCFLAVMLIVAKRYPELIGRKNRQLVEGATEVEDTIYRDHFDRDIQQAASAGNWREACRLTYLHALRLLHDAGRIAWRPYKTPTQYTREVTTADFRTLTNHFIRIRYGGFGATRELFDAMQGLFTSVVSTETAAPEAAASTKEPTEKGGEA